MIRIFLDPRTKRAAILALAGDPRFPEVIEAGVRASILYMTRDVAKNRLLGQYLRRRTGTLIRSVEASPRIDEVSRQRIRGAWGTHLGYGMAHEIGFVGTVTVPEHTRRRFRFRSKTGKRLRKRVREEGVIRVRQHSRQMRIRARHYIRDTVREAREPTARRLAKALRIWFRTRRIPTPGELIRG